MIQAGPGRRAPLKAPHQIYIGGGWVNPTTSDRIDVIAPATEELFVRVAEAKEADIDRAVSSARQAFDQGPWPRLSHRERAAYLRAIGEKLRQRAGDVATIWPQEMGIVHSMALAWAQGMGGVFDYYAGLAESFAFEERHQPTAGGNVGLLTREPVGVVGAIIPWNGPIIMICYKVAPALLAGCTVVIKASPEAPGAAYLMAEIAEEIGLPPGVINVVAAHRAASEALVRHPGVDKITFTGSSATGKRIAALCAERVARCTLELGGKSAALGAVRVGDPFDATTQMGPIVSRRQLDRIEHMVARGQEEGALLALDGRRPAHLPRGYFIAPTVFGRVENHSTIAREEIFGPVLSVMRVDTLDDAIELVNRSPFGNATAIFTSSGKSAREYSSRCEVGMVGVNVGVAAPMAFFPFAGWKNSFFGDLHAHGKDAVGFYTEQKVIMSRWF